MQPESGAEAPPESKPPSKVVMATGHRSPSNKHGASATQIAALICYYIVLLAGSMAAMVVLIIKEQSLLPSLSLLAKVGYVASGAVSGAVLYQIRMLYRYYIKDDNFDARWLGKYITAPWESVVLAVAVLSLIQGGGVVLGGENFHIASGKSFAAFGLGALIGFGIREAIGWLGGLAKTMFPTEPKP